MARAIQSAERARRSSVRIDLVMEIIHRFSEPPSACTYLPCHTSHREYLWVTKLDRDEYMAYLLAGWRRFGHMVFRQTCSGESACRSLRVDATRFCPDRSQRRNRKANEGVVRLTIGPPTLTPEKVALSDRFHAERSRSKGWSADEPGDAAEYHGRFVVNPFATQEWCYFIDETLVGVGYVDELAGGLSAIYFIRDPTHRDRALGTWNVLSLIDRATQLNLPYVYLGYHTEGCPSLQYKGRFRPHERLDQDGGWHDA
jgi:arginyl-tRNA--protein-N-Asp/Glu arginylyltransferase